jgi:Interferon-induced transmembrane protein
VAAPARSDGRPHRCRRSGAARPGAGAEPGAGGVGGTCGSGAAAELAACNAAIGARPARVVVLPLHAAFGPRRFLALSICATFFGFTPFGIVAIFTSLSVGKLVRAGRVAEAERVSRRARNWAIAALVLRVLWSLYYSFVLSS